MVKFRILRQDCLEPVHLSLQEEEKGDFGHREMGHGDHEARNWRDKVTSPGMPSANRKAAKAGTSLLSGSTSAWDSAS